jgi:hypothetical protein
MAKIQIELARADTEAVAALQALDAATVFAEPDHFEGSVEIISAIVTVTTASIPVIVKLVTEHIRSKRHIKIKMKGIEVSGASLKDVAKLLKDIKED